MDKVFQKFLRSGIDLSPVGVKRREDNNPYFCTPKGASIFGWHLFLAGRVWTASTSALFEALAVWYFPSVPWTRLRILFIRWQTILKTF